MKWNQNLMWYIQSVQKQNKIWKLTVQMKNKFNKGYSKTIQDTMLPLCYPKYTPSVWTTGFWLRQRDKIY